MLKNIECSRHVVPFGHLYWPIAPLVLSDSQLSLDAADAAHCYLVDPASSHMLVSKIKPCMSKYARPVQ